MTRTLRSLTLLLVGLAACNPQPPAPPPADLGREIAGLLDGLSARSSLFARHGPSGDTVAVRADQPMNTLSVIKIPVMIRVVRDVEAGRLRLADRHNLRPEELRRGSGLLQTFDPGLSVTVRDLVVQMIITSDNTATDILIGLVGLDRVNAMLDTLGFKTTRLRMTTGALFREVWIRADPANRTMTDREVFDRGFPGDSGAGARSFALEGDSTRWLGVTSAREMVTMLEGILANRYASADHSRMMVDILSRQFYASRLPQRVQWQGVGVAHKTGDWPPLAGNDVGILFYSGGPTVVAVFTGQNTGDFTELEATEGRIAERLVKEWK
ncbi:MAG: serine hydrolase [Gemmatimonadales bacterium]